MTKAYRLSTGFLWGAACAGWLLVACGDDSGDSPAPGDGGTEADGSTVRDAGPEPGADASTGDAGTEDGGNGGSMDAGAEDSGGSEGPDIVNRPPPDISHQVPDATPDTMTATSAGKDGLLTDTQQDGDDGDEAWTIMVDLDGDGEDDEVSVLFDEETQTIYTWWDDVIEGFCLDGSDANAVSMIVYSMESEEELLLWESDCSEDEDLIYGCDVTEAGGLEDCGFCELEDDRWSCTPEPSLFGELQNHVCECEVTCDGVASNAGLDLCNVPETEPVLEVAAEVCEEAYAEDCDEVACTCTCEEMPELTCE